jgi:hypothetical protein
MAIVLMAPTDIAQIKAELIGSLPSFAGIPAESFILVLVTALVVSLGVLAWSRQTFRLPVGAALLVLNGSVWSATVLSELGDQWATEEGWRLLTISALTRTSVSPRPLVIEALAAAQK